MIKVQKRDGQIVDFDITKIENAIAKAFDSVNKNYSKDIIELLALKVTATFNDKIYSKKDKFLYEIYNRKKHSVYIRKQLN